MRMSTENILVNVSAVILGIFGIAGNSLVLILFFKIKELRRISGIYMMIMLAAADVVCSKLFILRHKFFHFITR